MMPFKTRETLVTDPSIWAGANYVDLADPNPAEFRLEDIARALAHVPRFSGLTAIPYSVARHSLFCLRLAKMDGVTDAAVLRAVLMHDAPEAYLGDITRPLKALLPDYRRIEERLSAVLFHRFDVALPLFKARVAKFDNLALATEKAALFPDAPDWPGLPDPMGAHMIGMGGRPDTFAHAFIVAARNLGVPE